MFKVTRIYSDINGDSRFEDVEIPLKESGEIGSLSDLIPVTGFVFEV